MKKVEIITAVQAKAIRAICTAYIPSVANVRYVEIVNTIRENETMSTLLHMIGDAMHKEEVELEKEITNNLTLKTIRPVHFDDYRYCLTNTKEMKTAFINLMGW